MALGDIDTIPGFLQAISPINICIVVGDHAKTLYNQSYNKETGKFALSQEDAHELATRFFFETYSKDKAVDRFSRHARALGVPDLFAIAVGAYEQGQTVIAFAAAA